MISPVPSNVPIVSANFCPPVKFRDKTFPKLDTLLTRGPQVGIGRFGPGAYTGEALETDEFPDVFGFAKNTFRKKAPLVTVIFFQTIRVKDIDFVCYTLANCNSEQKTSPIQTANSIDQRIYLMTLNNFKDRSLTRIFPTISIAAELFTMDLDLITYASKAAETARGIGQQVYDLLRKVYGYSDAVAKKVLEALCESSKNPACLDLGFHGVGPYSGGRIDWERARWSSHPSVPADTVFHGE